MQATLKAFSDKPKTQCKFPAREKFLRKYYPNLPQVACHQFADYLSSISVENMSLIYASGYLGNPASMYGHVFLKFNGTNRSSLLDNTFNYGARYPADEHPIAYIFKGIFGGYEGYFANQKYHHQTLTYNESELRDLWEYELDIEKQDIEFILAHLWELENASMTYYFFKQNCAYQLAKLLELTTGKSLIAPGKVWVMPYDLIMMLDRHENGTLVKKVTHHGSRQQTLYEKYAQLNNEEQLLVSQVLNAEPDDVQFLLTSASETSLKRIIDTLYDYFAFLDKKNEGLTNKQSDIRKKALSVRFKMPPGSSNFKKTVKMPPHTSQDTAMLQLSRIYNQDWGHAYEVRFRANYYDQLSVNAARIPYSELSTFDVRAIYNVEQSSLDLREFTALRIVNLNVTNSGLPEDTGYAWKVATGYRELSLEEPSISSLYVDGFIGKSYEFIKDFALYSAFSGALTSKTNAGGNLALGFEIGGVLKVSPFYTMSMNMGHQRYVNAFERERTTFNFEQRFFNNKRFDVRSLVRYDKAFEYSVSLAYYY